MLFLEPNYFSMGNGFESSISRILLCFLSLQLAYIYVDKIAEDDVRHSAQTVFGIIILGGGPVIGGWLSGYLQNAYTVVSGPTLLVFDYSMFLVYAFCN